MDLTEYKEHKDNFDINKPTFVIYVKTDDISIERAEQLLHSAMDTKNANMWFITGTESKVECIWKGLEVEKTKNFSKMFEVLDDLIAKSKDKSEFVKLFRQLKLSQIF